MRASNEEEIRVEQSNYNFTIDEISKIQRTQIDGGDAPIMFKFREQYDYSIFKLLRTSPTQLKSIPHTIVNVKGKKYKASKSYDTNYLFPFREVIEKFLKTIASPIYIGKEYGSFFVIDGWMGSTANYAIGSFYSKQKKKELLSLRFLLKYIIFSLVKSLYTQRRVRDLNLSLTSILIGIS